MKKITIFAVLMSLFLFLIFSCTVAGAELSMVGTWKGKISKKFTSQGIAYRIDEKVTMTINSNDTGNLEFSSDGTSDNDDFKILKADSYAKTINLDFNTWGGDNDTYSYSLTYNQLIIKKFSLGAGLPKVDLILNK